MSPCPPSHLSCIVLQQAGDAENERDPCVHLRRQDSDSILLFLQTEAKVPDYIAVFGRGFRAVQINIKHKMYFLIFSQYEYGVHLYMLGCKAQSRELAFSFSLYSSIFDPFLQFARFCFLLLFFYF